jgi:hypothetical protein
MRGAIPYPLPIRFHGVVLNEGSKKKKTAAATARPVLKFYHEYSDTSFYINIHLL